MTATSKRARHAVITRSTATVVLSALLGLLQVGSDFLWYVGLLFAIALALAFTLVKP